MHDLILLRRWWVGIGHRMDRRCVAGVLHHGSRRRPRMRGCVMA